MENAYYITEDEFLLLSHLHENARGYGPGFGRYLPHVNKEMGWETKNMIKCASYLSEHGLIGMDMSRVDGGGVPPEHADIYLTGFGESYMRAIEHQPGIAKKITVAAAKEGWGFIKDTAAQILAAMAAARMSGHS